MNLKSLSSISAPGRSIGSIHTRAVTRKFFSPNEAVAEIPNRGDGMCRKNAVDDNVGLVPMKTDKSILHFACSASDDPQHFDCGDSPVGIEIAFLAGSHRCFYTRHSSKRTFRESSDSSCERLCTNG